MNENEDTDDVFLGGPPLSGPLSDGNNPVEPNWDALSRWVETGKTDRTRAEESRQRAEESRQRAEESRQREAAQKEAEKKMRDDNKKYHKEIADKRHELAGVLGIQSTTPPSYVQRISNDRTPPADRSNRNSPDKNVGNHHRRIQPHTHNNSGIRRS